MSYKSICAVPGVRAWGMKEGKFGLALIEAHGTAAGVFTENLVRAAPVELMKKQIQSGKLEAVIVNSGCANAYTGTRGYTDAVAMTEYAGSALGLNPARIGVGSTGVIGRYLDLPLIQRQCAEVAQKLDCSPEAEDLATKAIMTTDTFAKRIAYEVTLENGTSFRIGAMAKGAGMINPAMANCAIIPGDAWV